MSHIHIHVADYMIRSCMDCKKIYALPSQHASKYTNRSCPTLPVQTIVKLVPDKLTEANESYTTCTCNCWSLVRDVTILH